MRNDIFLYNTGSKTLSTKALSFFGCDIANNNEDLQCQIEEAHAYLQLVALPN